MTPKAFLSYSWSSPGHQSTIREWAERLLSDGVDVVLDQFDLKEGHDKYAFMEKMVTDSSVTNVLVFSDMKYAEKADSRLAGVGTESQIISNEVYQKVEQSKFIPIVCEKDEQGNPYLPTFLKARIWIDFTSPEAVNENWEQLVRALHGKPIHEKPGVGKVPSYIASPRALPSSGAGGKLSTLRAVILSGRPGAGLYRREFLDECLLLADSLRIRTQPLADGFGEKVLEDSTKLREIRQLLVDWLILETTTTPDDGLRDDLLDFLEKLRSLKARAPELGSWNDAWFEAHSLFIYETFLYFIAVLLKAKRYHLLADVFGHQYLIPESDGRGPDRFEGFQTFYAHSEALQSVLSGPGRRLLSPAAALVQRQANRTDIDFRQLLQADALCFLVATVSSRGRWYPQMLHYLSYGTSLPFFVRCAQKRQFVSLGIVTG